MRFEVGEIITLDSNGKDYLVVKEVNYDNKNYYYLMTAKKPLEILIVELKVQDGREVVETVTDKDVLNNVMKLISEE
jgi:hypothetical protein